MRRARWSLYFGLSLAMGLGCRCDDPARSAAQPTPVSSAASAAPRCQAGPRRYTLQADRAEASTADDALPFAVELGSVMVGADADAFAVPFLRPAGQRTHAGLLQLDSKLAESQVIELGAVHGDAPVPRVAAHEAGWAVALADSDASGAAYRLGWIPLPAAGRDESVAPRWGAEFDPLPDDSPAFDIAVSGRRAVLVWDEWDRHGNRSRIRAGTALVERLEAPDERVLSPSATDAEVPRVVSRPSGFWVAWAALQAQPRPAASPGAADVQVIRRWLELLPLDERAMPAGEPIVVSSKRGFVQDYDLWVTPEQAVLVAWRERPASNGLREGIVHLARVNSDGSVERQVIEHETAGATLATLVGDPQPESSAPSLWLTTEARGGKTALAAVDLSGRLLEPLEPVPELGVGAVVAALRGRLLVAEPRGRDLSLLSYRCSPVAAASAGAGEE